MILPSRISTATITARRVSSGLFVLGAPENIHLVGDGRLIHAADFEDVAQDRPARLRGSVPTTVPSMSCSVLYSPESCTGKLRPSVRIVPPGITALRAEIESITVSRRQPVAGDIGVREQQVNRFLNDGDLGDFADALDLLQFVLEIAREQFERAIAVTRRRVKRGFAEADLRLPSARAAA